MPCFSWSFPCILSMQLLTCQLLWWLYSLYSGSTQYQASGPILLNRAWSIPKMDEHRASPWLLQSGETNWWFSLSILRNFIEVDLALFQIRAFNENCLMVRQPAVEIMECMRAANYSAPIIRYLLCILFIVIKLGIMVMVHTLFDLDLWLLNCPSLDGRAGSGKSTTLAHVIHHCGVQGWVVVHVPWGEYALSELPQVLMCTKCNPPSSASSSPLFQRAGSFHVQGRTSGSACRLCKVAGSPYEAQWSSVQEPWCQFLCSIIVGVFACLVF